ncbi:FAD-dependent oxidoreductase [Natronorubrum sp. DTA7]|uniref:FAD-dependent oxidoreductase n=1 Tax=Natronorubrum sp. DTA7 TaxID=3447016 RepID=UPI003F848D6D
MTDDRRDVAIVGGGVVGCAIARALSPAYDVSLFERGTLASGATARAAGEVTMAPSYTDYPRSRSNSIGSTTARATSSLPA